MIKTIKCSLCSLVSRVLTTRNVRIAFVVFCLAWFVHMSSYLVSKYDRHETAIDYRLESPNETFVPAFTVCGPFVVCPVVLEKRWKKYNDSLRRITGKKEEKSWNRQVGDLRNTMEAEFLRHQPAIDVIDNLSIRVEDFISDCQLFLKSLPLTPLKGWDKKFESLQPQNCSEVMQVVPSIIHNRKCFTFFSLLKNKTKSQAAYKRAERMRFDQNPMIRVKIRVRHDRWMIGRIETTPMIMSVHPPFTIPTTLDYPFYRIYAGAGYLIRFRTKTFHRLQEPYKNPCHRYSRNTSQFDCIGKCIKCRLAKLDHSTANCSQHHSVLTRDLLKPTDRICTAEQMNDETLIRVHKSARNECVRRCRESCEQVKYDIKAYQINLFDIDGDDNVSDVEIKIDSTPSRVVTFKPLVCSLRFFSSILEYAVIWLGISVIEFFDYIVHGVKKIAMKWRRSDDQTCRVDDDGFDD